MTTDTSSADSAFIHSDLSGLCHWASPTFLQRVGLSLEQLRGQFWLKVVHPDDRTRIMNLWDDAMARRAPCALSFRVQLPSGSIETLHLRAQPIHTTGHGGEFCVGWLTTPSAEAQLQSDEALQERIESLTRELRTHADVERALRDELEKFSKDLEQSKARDAERIRCLEQSLHDASTTTQARSNLEDELKAAQEQLSQVKAKLEDEVTAHATSRNGLQKELERVRGELERDISSLKNANESLQKLLSAREQSTALAADTAAQVLQLRAKEEQLMGEKRALEIELIESKQEQERSASRVSALNDANQQLRNEVQALYHTQADLGRRLEQQEREFQSIVAAERRTLQSSASEEMVRLQAHIAALEKELLATQALAKQHAAEDHSGDTAAPAAKQIASLLEFQASQLGIQLECEVRCLEAHSFMHPDEVKHLAIELLRQLAQRKALVDQTDVQILLGRQSMRCRIGPCVMGSVEAETLAIFKELRSRGGRLNVEQAGAHEWFELQIGPETAEKQPASVAPAVPAATEAERVEVKTVTTNAPQQERASPRVLVAEDNLINQRVIGKLLQELGCQVDFAANGREVFEQLQRNTYELIFMDCQMPVVDGYEATKGVRAMERNKPSRTPIVAMSAHVDIDSEKRCRDCGMEFYLTKPIQRSRIQSILSTIGLAKAA